MLFVPEAGSHPNLNGDLREWGNLRQLLRNDIDCKQSAKNTHLWKVMSTIILKLIICSLQLADFWPIFWNMILDDFWRPCGSILCQQQISFHFLATPFFDQWSIPQ
jgi:hypothetical protein